MREILADVENNVLFGSRDHRMYYVRWYIYRRPGWTQ
jgi:hypothetical protein